MAIQLAARDRSETKTVRSSWLRDVFAGSICGVLSIAFGLSYAVLIFSGPLAPWLSYGVAATFASTGIAALVVALRGSLPFAIAGPDSSTSAVTAVLAAALVERLVAEGAGNQLLMPTLIVMAIGSALTGILLCGLGLARAGRAIRFVPYPVIGGFLGATGWLVVSGAVLVVTDLQLSVHNLEALFSASSIAKLLVCCSDLVPKPLGVAGSFVGLLRNCLPRNPAQRLATFDGANSRLDVQTAGCNHVLSAVAF